MKIIKFIPIATVSIALLTMLVFLYLKDQKPKTIERKIHDTVYINTLDTFKIKFNCEPTYLFCVNNDNTEILQEGKIYTTHFPAYNSVSDEHLVYYIDGIGERKARRFKVVELKK